MKKRICCCIFGMMLAMPYLLSAQARIQIIHNMPDPALDSVTVYINGLPLPPFKYLDATLFQDVQIVNPVVIAVAPANSVSLQDTIASFNVTLVQNERYIALLNGVRDPNLFAANPQALPTRISLSLKSAARETPVDTLSVEFFVAQGVTDAPAVDVLSPTLATPLANNASYGALSNYVTVPPALYTLNVTSAITAEVLGQFMLDVAAKAGSTAVVFTSGFLNPQNNQDGSPLSVYAAFADGDVVQLAPSGLARLQLIHNAADTTLSPVDVYLNNTLLIDDFFFRDATPFLDILALNNLTLGIAPGNSASAAEVFLSSALPLTPNERYVAFLNGVRNPAAFAPNPGGLQTGLAVVLKSGTREVPVDTTRVEFFVAHGTTDAPVIDVVAQTVATPLADNLAYGTVTDYVSIPPAVYTVNVMPADNNTQVLAQFSVALDTLAKRSIVLFASGFLSPLNNQLGDSLALLGALANGTVIKFAPSGRARLQVIHASADTTLKSVDVYLNNELFIPDFQFLDASPFLDVLAVNNISLGIAPATSVSVADTIKSFNLVLTPNDRYVGFLRGVRDPNAFAQNPDTLTTGLAFSLKGGVRPASVDSLGVEFFIAQNATDAPTVDIRADSIATPLADNIRYGAITDYIAIPPANYRVDITSANDTLDVLAKFDRDLTVVRGIPLVVFTAGFLNPAGNLNGEQLGLFIALPDGELIEFNRFGQAGLQIIHNASDPAIAALDIYLNNRLFVNDLGFRKATPYLPTIADTLSVLSVAPSTSLSAAEAILTTNIPMIEDSLYIAVLNGLLTPATFAPNPDSVNTTLSVFIKSNGIREEAQDTTNATVDILMIQGIPDLPTSDFVTLDRGTIVDNAMYGTVTDYISLPAVDYLIFLTGRDNVADLLARFELDLSEMESDAIVVLTSGFIQPSLNQNGPSIDMIAVTGQGVVRTFNKVLSVDGPSVVPLVFALHQNYPNPFNPSTTIRFSLPTPELVSLKIFDIRGRLVSVLADRKMPAGEYAIDFDARSLASGRYFYRLVAGKYSAAHGMTLIK